MRSGVGHAPRSFINTGECPPHNAVNQGPKPGGGRRQGPEVGRGSKGLWLLCWGQTVGSRAEAASGEGSVTVRGTGAGRWRGPGWWHGGSSVWILVTWSRSCCRSRHAREGAGQRRLQQLPAVLGRPRRSRGDPAGDVAPPVGSLSGGLQRSRLRAVPRFSTGVPLPAAGRGRRGRATRGPGARKCHPRPRVLR